MFPAREEKLAYYEKQMNGNPKGRLARRLEDGGLRLYYEDGDFSFPVPDDMLSMLRRGTGDRKAAEKQIRELKYWIHRDGENPGTAYAGDALRARVAPAARLQKRDCYADLERYLYGDVKEGVCAMFGLKGTGKTTLMLQAIMGMSEEDFSRTAYYAADRRQSCHDIRSCLNSLSSQGVRYAFVDNITRLDDFIDYACIFEFLHTEKGMKVVLSGPDSISFHFTSHDELYDNLFLVHTTWMSFAEYSRLTGILDRDYYLERGGVLYPSFEEKDLDGYIEDAVALPIEHLLKTRKLGYRQGLAENLISADEFRPFLHRLVDKATMDFLFSITASLPMPQADRDILLDAVLHEYLRRNDEEYTANDENGLEGAKCWSLSYMVGMEFFQQGKGPEYWIAVQPGIRCMLSRSILEGALQHAPFTLCSIEAREELYKSMLQAVKDRMLDDLAWYESTLAK
ncbi:MAG: AAA family ATPase [Clostridia bacterium]|nr:AAA family ATPase [Clostridia bacterium]